MLIRPFTEEDFPAVVEIHNAIWPDKPTSIEEMINEDLFKRSKDIFFHRFVLQNNDKVIAFGHIGQVAWFFHPQKFEIEVNVHPNHYGKGFGKALYECLFQVAEINNAIVLRTKTREDQKRTIGFLMNRNFKEEMRIFESRLDVNVFDFAPYQGVIEQVEANGYQLTTLNKLINDSDRDKKLYELIKLLNQDVPTPEPATVFTFERFKERFFQDKNLLLEAYFIAIKDDKYVGMCSLWQSQADPHLHTGLTGVVRDHRRHKVALALKLKGIEYAKKHDFARIYTSNNSINQPILSINEALGFVKQPAWLQMIKKLGEQ